MLQQCFFDQVKYAICRTDTWLATLNALLDVTFFNNCFVPNIRIEKLVKLNECLWNICHLKKSLNKIMRWNYWCLPIVLKELSNLWCSLFCFLLCDLLLIIMKCKMPFTKHWNQWWNVLILGTSKSKFLYYIIHKNWFMYIQNVRFLR